MKKNNKGFSLVELIVVVLIMAIIAVALAPQVMKWVENSRKSTDCSNYDSVVEAVNLAIADETIMEDLATGDRLLTWDDTGWSIDTDTPNKSIMTKIGGILGSTWDTTMVVKATQGVPTGGYEITIKSNGTVERTQAPSANLDES